MIRILLGIEISIHIRRREPALLVPTGIFSGVPGRAAAVPPPILAFLEDLDFVSIYEIDLVLGLLRVVELDDSRLEDDFLPWRCDGPLLISSSLSQTWPVSPGTDTTMAELIR